MHKYLVSDNQQITPTTILLTLKINQRRSKPFSFQPGQYAVISFKNRGRPTPARCFSIVNSPINQGILQLSTRTEGRFTRALADVKNGDEVKVRGPYGGFVFDAERHADTVLIAGGIGITPFMSMIQYAERTNLTNNITLLFSCRDQDDIPFLEQLTESEKRNPHFKAVYAIGRGPTDKLMGQKATTGRITPEIIDRVVQGAYDKKTFFICGPPSFMQGMTRILQDKDVPDGKIMTEAFSQGPNRQTGKIRSWPFNIYALSALGVALGSFIVMVNDLLKTLPPSSISAPPSVSRLSAPTNSRQTDLDKLVNSLPDVVNTNPATAAAAKASQQSKTSTPAPASSPSSNSAPAPAPAPKCTTSQSGVTTCM